MFYIWYVPLEKFKHKINIFNIYGLKRYTFQYQRFSCCPIFPPTGKKIAPKKALINPHLADTTSFVSLPTQRLFSFGFGIHSQTELGDCSERPEPCSLLLSTRVDLAKLTLGLRLTKKMKWDFGIFGEGQWSWCMITELSCKELPVRKKLGGGAAGNLWSTALEHLRWDLTKDYKILNGR